MKSNLGLYCSECDGNKILEFLPISSEVEYISAWILRPTIQHIDVSYGYLER